MNQQSNRSVESLVDEYTSAAARWVELQGDASSANRVFDRLQELQKVFRAYPRGRAAISELTRSDVPGVRLVGATHMLAFDPEAAIPVLNELETLRGLHSVSAKYTLRSYRAGTLNLDW